MARRPYEVAREHAHERPLAAQNGRRAMDGRWKFPPYFAGAAVVVSLLVLGAPLPGSAADQQGSVVDAAREPLFGDVYAEPTRWRELPLSAFFTEGRDEPWARAVKGGRGGRRAGRVSEG